ncbi:putative ABC transporter [Aspergillus undulatus]|uniref:putative ABC transporter n=1 Tax=Aspergillus undulatus TaxID=1810928 RepID=UPI003CCE314F
MSSLTLPLGVSAAACAVAILLSIPHGHAFISRYRRDKAYRLIESDNDESITTGKSPRSLWQRVCLVLISAMATAVASGSWMTTTSATPAKMLGFATWCAILFQETVLSTSRNPTDRYNLGCYSALTALATGGAIVLPNALALHSNQRLLALTSHDALTIIQLVAAFILLLINLSVPRGSFVYRDGRIVDAQDSVSFLNRYTFSWAYRTLSLATKHGKLNPEDLPVVSQEVRAQTLSDNFFAAGSTSVQWKKWFNLYWRNAAVQITIQLCSGAVRFLPNLLLLTILRLFEDRDAGASNQLQLWLTALSLGLSMITSSWLISLRDFIADLKISLPVNEQLFAVITKKAMGLKDIVVPARGGAEDEEEEDVDDDDDDESDEAPRTKHSILNLLGVDVGKISDFIAYSHLLLDSVVELTLTIIFLVYLMGWKSTVAGCIIPFLLSPVYYKITKTYSEKEQALMDRRDEKSASLTEMVRGMRQIKFSALESEWYQKIQNLRGKELQQQQAVFRLTIYLTAIWTFGPICMSFLSIAAYVYLNGAISPSTAFTALSLFENLQNILSILPEVVTDLLDAGVSLRRIARFLGLEDYADDRVPGDGIVFSNATITWPSKASEDSDSQFQLKDLNLNFPSEALSIISGRSGAGKSLLLQAIIGEADVVKGTVTVPQPAPSSNLPASPHDWIINGAVAYVSQDPWIENATIRDSILFGLPRDPARYQDVIEACALSPDLKIFPDGDKTDVGANGINLSGGQKWRLALARALYSRASILVFDDIFSAVDSHVGRHLYENALTGPLAHGRTRVLATHHVKLCLSGSAYLVKLEKGNVVEARNLKSTEGECWDTADSSETSDSRPATPKASSHPARRGSVSSAKKFYEEEKRHTGVVNAKVYKTYISASGGYFAWVAIVLILVMLLLLNLAIPYWVSIWTRSYEQAGDSLVTQSPDNALGVDTARRPQIDKRLVYYGSIYLAISASSWILDIVRIAIILNGSIKASKEIFEKFTAAVLHAPLRFLDTTPVGQILNRFTSDFGILDSDLASDLSYTMHDFITLLGVLVAALVTSPLIVGLGIVALAVSWVIGYIYVTGAREAKRLESTAKSPIFELVGSLLTGLPTIRAFGREKAYLNRMYDLIDAHCQTLWHRRLFSCWMDFWLCLVGAVFVASVTMVFVSIRTLDAPLAGFALSFALDMSSVISWLLAQYADLEINSNAAERIVEYTQLETEPDSGTDVPAAWPAKGEIEVTDLTVAYAPELPPVLRSLDFCIRPGERVGVVGRTGAGKSSFAMTLLRCLDIRSGTIHIDGVDIGKVKLHDLRSRVGMISQDPIVFAGTVRQVLDPFNQHDDTELRDALEKVSLSSPNQTTSHHNPTSTSPDDQPSSSLIPLSFTIAEGGKNLSQGQRQLLCLARALVSSPKILIMDEATASIDMESDILIQRALRREISGSGCTLIVIAHRLSTIADFDRIVVLEKGEVVEIDSPKHLMKIEGGIFRGLVEGSGEREGIEGMIFGGVGARSKCGF